MQRLRRTDWRTVHLGGRLCGEKCPCVLLDTHLEMDRIAADQTSAVCGRIHPCRRSVIPWVEQLERTCRVRTLNVRRAVNRRERKLSCTRCDEHGASTLLT